jgi:CDP-glycerol glycerophosphotransferase (TagB/SpsB family)
MKYFRLSRIVKMFNREIKNIIYMIVSLVFYIIDIFYPKKKKLILFSQKHNLFSDNSRAFFEYINFHEKDFDAIWITANEDGKRKILAHNKDFKVLNIKSLDGILTLLAAKTVVISNSLHDFFPYFKTSFKKEAVQLWHGIKWSKQYEYPNNNFTNDLTIICSSSEEHKKLMSEQNLINKNKIYITGFSRNDIFFDNSKENIKQKLPTKVLSDLGKKIILYTPTHKEDINSIFFPFKDLNLEKLNNFFSQNNIILYLRPHINDSNKSKEKWLNYFNKFKMSNIKDLTFGELEDINFLLPFTKIVITDYSTIYTDAMLLDIPTIFIPYDLEVYRKKRGLVYNYENVTAGHKVYNQDSFEKSINEIINGKNKYSSKLNEMKNIFHKYKDGKSSQRIMHIIKEKISFKNEKNN